MSSKWIVETTKFDSIHFIWDDGSSTLRLHAKQLDEAMKIAKEFGYRPFSFFRPPMPDLAMCEFLQNNIPDPGFIRSRCVQIRMVVTK